MTTYNFPSGVFLDQQRLHDRYNLRSGDVIDMRNATIQSNQCKHPELGHNYNPRLDGANNVTIRWLRTVGTIHGTPFGYATPIGDEWLSCYRDSSGPGGGHNNGCSLYLQGCSNVRLENTYHGRDINSLTWDYHKTNSTNTVMEDCLILGYCDDLWDNTQNRQITARNCWFHGFGGPACEAGGGGLCLLDNCTLDYMQWWNENDARGYPLRHQGIKRQGDQPYEFRDFNLVVFDGAHEMWWAGSNNHQWLNQRAIVKSGHTRIINLSHVTPVGQSYPWDYDTQGWTEVLTGSEAEAMYKQIKTEWINAHTYWDTSATPLHRDYADNMLAMSMPISGIVINPPSEPPPPPPPTTEPPPPTTEPPSTVSGLPITLDSTNVSGSAIVNLTPPSNPTAATVTLDVYDADWATEAQMRINGNEWIVLYGPWPAGADATRRNVQISVDPSLFVDGDNLFEFEWLETGGSVIYDISVGFASTGEPPPPTTDDNPWPEYTVQALPVVLGEGGTGDVTPTNPILRGLITVEVSIPTDAVSAKLNFSAYDGDVDGEATVSINNAWDRTLFPVPDTYGEGHQTTLPWTLVDIPLSAIRDGTNYILWEYLPDTNGCTISNVSITFEVETTQPPPSPPPEPPPEPTPEPTPIGTPIEVPGPWPVTVGSTVSRSVTLDPPAPLNTRALLVLDVTNAYHREMAYIHINGEGTTVLGFNDVDAVSGDPANRRIIEIDMPTDTFVQGTNTLEFHRNAYADVTYHGVEVVFESTTPIPTPLPGANVSVSGLPISLEHGGVEFGAGVQSAHATVNLTVPSGATQCFIDLDGYDADWPTESRLTINGGEQVDLWGEIPFHRLVDWGPSGHPSITRRVTFEVNPASFVSGDNDFFFEHTATLLGDRIEGIGVRFYGDGSEPPPSPTPEPQPGTVDDTLPIDLMKGSAETGEVDVNVTMPTDPSYAAVSLVGTGITGNTTLQVGSGTLWLIGSSVISLPVSEFASGNNTLTFRLVPDVPAETAVHISSVDVVVHQATTEPPPPPLALDPSVKANLAAASSAVLSSITEYRTRLLTVRNIISGA